MTLSRKYVVMLLGLFHQSQDEGERKRVASLRNCRSVFDCRRQLQFGRKLLKNEVDVTHCEELEKAQIEYTKR
jgi:hypothetical protein